MILSGTSLSEVPISSTTQMYLTHNGELFDITLCIKQSPKIVLSIEQSSNIFFSVQQSPTIRLHLDE